MNYWRQLENVVVVRNTKLPLWSIRIELKQPKLARIRIFRQNKNSLKKLQEKEGWANSKK